MVATLPENSKCLFNRPVENLRVFFSVPKLPALVAISAKASADGALVVKLRLAPNAPAPLVEVPTPL